MDQRFEDYIRRRLGDTAIDNMRPRTKNEMMSSWERKMKYRFGNASGPEGYEVQVLDLPDSRELNIEEGFHSMETYVTMATAPVQNIRRGRIMILTASGPGRMTSGGLKTS